MLNSLPFVETEAEKKVKETVSNKTFSCVLSSFNVLVTELSQINDPKCQYGICLF